ncbi:small membrane protein YldA [Citrobacter sp. NCU1]|nr:small membrane protein YldA [Citrobacter sp. NCU1]
MAEVLGITVVYILIAAVLVAAVLFLEQHW